MAWLVGSIVVPDHHEVRNGAFDYGNKDGPFRPHQPEKDWDVSEAMALQHIGGYLFYMLGRSRAASVPLARCLLRCSNGAHSIWQEESGNWRDVLEPRYFLTAIGCQIIQGWRGGSLFYQMFDYPTIGKQYTPDRAYAIWEAEGHPNGRDQLHWRIAEWHRKVVDIAHETCGNPTDGHYLRAVGTIIMRNPDETLQVFEPNFA